MAEEIKNHSLLSNRSILDSLVSYSEKMVIENGRLKNEISAMDDRMFKSITNTE